MINLSSIAKTSAWLNDLIRRNPLVYRRFLRIYAIAAKMSDDELRRWNAERLRAVLSRASRTPYGRSIADPLDLHSWPILEKSVVRQAPERFERGSHLFAVSATTGGTTGIPLKLSRSFSSLVGEQAALDFLFRKAGVDPRRCRLAVLRGDSFKDPNDMTTPYWKYVGAGRRLLLSAFHMTPATVGAYAEELIRFSPQALMAYPSAIESLCALLDQQDLKLFIPLVITSSEMLSPATWDLVTTVMGARVIDRYGQAERVAFAYGESPSAYFFLPGYGHVELFPLANVEQPGLFELIATPFWNSRMPLVRYRTGDLVRVGPDASSHTLDQIVLGRAPFGGIHGRQSDYVVAPDGRRILAMNHLPREVENVIQIQIVQESRERIRILVVPAERYSDRDARVLLKNAAAKLPATMSITIETVEALHRTSNGKVPFIVRERGLE